MLSTLVVVLMVLNAHFEAGFARSAVIRNNPALGKTSYQSSTYANSNGALVSDLAVDGSISQVPFPYNAQHSCSNTMHDVNAWWAVDLGRPFKIYSVTIFLCRQHYKLMKDAIIGVTNVSPVSRAPLLGSYPLCGQLDGVPLNDVMFTRECFNPPEGRYVVVQMPRQEWLTLSEVVVDGEPLNTDARASLMGYDTVDDVKKLMNDSDATV